MMDRLCVCLQLCLSGLSDRRRLQANAAILGVSLLMEDVLNSGREAEPVRLHGDKVDLLRDGNPNEVKDGFRVVMAICGRAGRWFWICDMSRCLCFRGMNSAWRLKQERQTLLFGIRSEFSWC